ncbi:MAG: glycoside hydrolase family 57, partial [Candidatus Omnitrophica bacterium]|nr:glycoside hydrolase family 57 [Candidatus Omnitrophota bacterium]
MDRPLYIAFVWHMHQPYYKDPLTGRISMPWVRLHGIKDYLNMLDILRGFPRIRQTFNVVPSLLDQIEDYTAGELPDEQFLKISLKPAKDLDYEEKKFMILNFFMANWENMIAPLPRFYELLLKRGKFFSPPLVDRVVDNFRPQDYLDLQVLYNLCWFDPVFRARDELLSQLVKKGSRFSEEDKALALKKQMEVMRKIIPAYRQMQDSGQIEVSISPYYHPILPLLCDTNAAKTGMPGEPLPRKRFSHPEDAGWHIENSVKKYNQIFGRAPSGMWPSEGSVSEDILPLIIKSGIKWIATDEAILAKSLNREKTSGALYRPYLLRRGNDGLNIIFRDRGLSDAIGFIYQNIPAPRAVDDFISHLHSIREGLNRYKDRAFLVSIVLDGENAWEYYPNNGHDFLNLLYLRLTEEEPLLKTTTVSEFLNNNPPSEEIQHLYPGSWINGNYAIWIGQDEKNASWDYLSTT